MTSGTEGRGSPPPLEAGSRPNGRRIASAKSPKDGWGSVAPMDYPLVIQHSYGKSLFE